MFYKGINDITDSDYITLTQAFEIDFQQALSVFVLLDKSNGMTRNIEDNISSFILHLSPNATLDKVE